MRGQMDRKHLSAICRRMNGMRKWCVCCMIVGLTMIVACRPRAIYHVFLPVDPHGWKRTDTLVFDLPMTADSTEWQVGLGVRCTNQLQYQDLWLVVEERSNIVRRDTIHMLLMDGRGEWLEPSSILHSAERPITTLCLSVPNTKLLVYHVMRPFSVAGISEVGIKLEPAVSTLLPVASGINAK